MNDSHGHILKYTIQLYTKLCDQITEPCKQHNQLLFLQRWGFASELYVYIQTIILCLALCSVSAMLTYVKTNTCGVLPALKSILTHLTLVQNQ